MAVQYMVSVNDVDLFYEVHGSGAPLMLIAGLASDSQSWQPIVGDLARHFHVITPDNRGVGRTAPPDIGISIQKISDDCVALLGLLGISSVNLLGHSMGGFVALDCAIRYPQLVSKLVLAGTSSSNSQRNNRLFRDWARTLESGMEARQWWQKVFSWLFTERFLDNGQLVNEALRFAIEYPYPQEKRAFRNQVEAIARFDCSAGLAGIRAETLVVYGAEDILFPPEENGRILQAIPGASTCLIENAAHSLHLENPGAFVHAIVDFLGTGGSASASGECSGK